MKTSGSCDCVPTSCSNSGGSSYRTYRYVRKRLRAACSVAHGRLYCSVGGWMDGRMDGRVNVLRESPPACGRSNLDGCMDGWMYKILDGLMDKLIYGWMFGYMDGQSSAGSAAHRRCGRAPGMRERWRGQECESNSCKTEILVGAKY